MLIAKAMQEERYEDAQRILDGIPDRTVDKEERQAILYAREGKDEDAARTWEARVIRRFDGGDCRVDRNCVEGWPQR